MGSGIDWRLAFFILWGGGCVLIYGVVFMNRLALYRKHHDRRSRRDLGEASGLFLVAGSAALAIMTVLFAPEAASVRGLVNALALGGFLGVGVIMATEGPPEK